MSEPLLVVFSVTINGSSTPWISGMFATLDLAKAEALFQAGVSILPTEEHNQHEMPGYISEIWTYVFSADLEIVIESWVVKGACS